MLTKNANRRNLIIFIPKPLRSFCSIWTWMQTRSLRVCFMIRLRTGTISPLKKIAQMFGKDIARMVDGVTKLTNSNLSHMLSKEDRQAENLRKMFLAIANDVRVVVIKLADRLHNMRTLGYCSKEKRVRKARETMDVYAPLRTGSEWVP